MLKILSEGNKDGKHVQVMTVTASYVQAGRWALDKIAPEKLNYNAFCGPMRQAARWRLKGTSRQKAWRS